MDVMTAVDYKKQLVQSLPPGDAWPSDDPVLGAVLDTIASRFAKMHADAVALLDETDPRTMSYLLGEWENFLGLPDECTAEFTTVQERRNAVWQRLTTLGGQNVGMFQSIAELLGYNVVITPFIKPFICGRSRCGERLNGGHNSRNIWSVRVLGPRITRFRCGQSRCGERLGTIARATDLECIFNRLKPAHLVLWFIYEE
jgi:uncharacterized protein YmfQ (DUF2313 family)